MTGSPRTEAKREAVNAAMSVAEDLAKGNLDPTALDAAVVAECRQLVGQVLGPEDGEMWELQQDIARQVMAVGYTWSAAELREWAAAQELREGPPPREESVIERLLAAGADDDEED